MLGQDRTSNGTLAVIGAESQEATLYLTTHKRLVPQQLLTQPNMLRFVFFGLLSQF